jgi:prepilin-type processing-associated H-X9-DG protein
MQPVYGGVRGFLFFDCHVESKKVAGLAGLLRNFVSLS